MNINEKYIRAQIIESTWNIVRATAKPYIKKIEEDKVNYDKLKASHDKAIRALKRVSAHTETDFNCPYCKRIYYYQIKRNEKRLLVK